MSYILKTSDLYKSRFTELIYASIYVYNNIGWKKTMIWISNHLGSGVNEYYIIIILLYEWLYESYIL